MWECGTVNGWTKEGGLFASLSQDIMSVEVDLLKTLMGVRMLEVLCCLVEVPRRGVGNVNQGA